MAGMYDSFGKILLFMGFILILFGGIFIFLSKFSGGFKMPLDIYYKKGNFTFYFPLGTSILISIILSLILYLLSRIKH